MYRRKLDNMYVYFTPNGEKYDLDNGRNKVVLSVEGEGMPPIDYITQRGPFQHGETLLDYFLQPRTIQLIARQRFGCRNDYLNGRRALLDILRPNHSDISSGTLRKYMSDGTKRDINVHIQEGPRFEPRTLGRWQEFSFQETLRFVAFNPIYYDPTQQTTLFASSDGELVFPITFPIVFGVSGYTTTIMYTGTWVEYPTIEVAGPFNSFVIQNTTTDEQIVLTYTAVVGETVTFDLSFGVKTVTSSLGTNLMPYVSSDSDLTTFHLQPGNNSIAANLSGGTLSSQVVIRWYKRYIGT